MSCTSRFPALCLILLVAPPVVAQQTLLRYQPPVGSQKTYDAQVSGDITITIQLPGATTPQQGKVSGAMRMTENVTAASTDGYRTVEAQFVSADITYNEQRLPLGLVGRKLQFSRDLLGRVSNLTTQPAGNGDLSGMMGFDPLEAANDLSLVVAFPEKPVGPGDSWENEYDIPAKDGSRLRVSTQSCLKQFTEAAGRPVAMVDSKARVPLVVEQQGMRIMGQMNANIRSLYYLDDGTLARSQSRAAIKLSIYNVKADGTAEPMGACEIPDLQSVVVEATGA